MESNQINGEDVPRSRLLKQTSRKTTCTEFKGKRGTVFNSLLAITIWLGAFQFNSIVLLASFLLLPRSMFFAVVGLYIVITVIPIEEMSKLGRKLARYICEHGCGYFPITLHVEDVKDFELNQAYVFGYEPHSVFPLGSIALSDQTGFMQVSKIKVLASSAIFHIPIIRQVWTWMGLAPASRESFVSLLKSGWSCLIIPGGVQEIVHMEHGSEIAFLKSRRGFVRVAMEVGCPIVPVYCFGQFKAYKWWKPGGKLYQKLCRTIRFTPIIYWGIFWSHVPFRQPMDVVVGRPIHVQKNPEPSLEEVAQVLNQYIEELTNLFETHKARLGYEDAKLKIL